MTVILLKPRRFADERGWFMETYHDRRYQDLGIKTSFVQDNHSYSKSAGTIRGIHFQRPPHTQAKLVRCIRGSILDVAVDLRPASPTFGTYVSAELSAENGHQLWVPAGYGHAFMTLEPDTEVAYKVDDYYAPQSEGGIRWNDPLLSIEWPLGKIDRVEPVVSAKDAILPAAADVQLDFAYDGHPLLSLKN